MVATDLFMPGVSFARKSYDALNQLYIELKNKFDSQRVDYTQVLSKAGVELRKIEGAVKDMEDYLVPHINIFNKIDETLDLLVTSEFHFRYFRNK